MFKDVKDREVLKTSEIVAFESVQAKSPRGNNNYVFFKDNLKIIGRTYEHKIGYDSFKEIFYTKKIAEGKQDQHYLIVKINPAIRQGLSLYEYIVFIFDDSNISDVDVKLSDEVSQKYPKLKKSYSGSAGEIFLKIIKAFTNLEEEDNGNFQTSNQKNGVKCSIKAFEGEIHPLKDCLLFLPKAIKIPLKEINIVEFSRINISSRTAKTYDMKIFMLDGSAHNFNALDKDEFNSIERYFSKNNIEVRSEVIANDVSTEAEDETTDDYYEEETQDDTDY